MYRYLLVEFILLCAFCTSDIVLKHQFNRVIDLTFFTRLQITCFSQLYNILYVYVFLSVGNEHTTSYLCVFITDNLLHLISALQQTCYIKQ